MKKTVALLVILLSVIGIVYAQHGGSGGASSGGGEVYSCMWSPSENDCVDGHDNYCICVKE